MDIVLRDVTEADLPVFFEQQNDPAANEAAGFPARDRESFMAHWKKIMADPTNVLKTIVNADDVAGNIGSFVRFGEREVCYWIGREYWGRGIATRALSQLLEQVTVRPLFARVALHNVASIRVLEKCGFTQAGDDGDDGVLLKLDG